MITLGAIVRDARPYLDTYLAQVWGLNTREPLRLVIGEGDSTDGTRQLLEDFLRPEDTLVDVTHGGPKWGSIDNAQRWEQIAGCVRKVIEAVDDPGGAFLWVEADLLWDPDTMLRLIEDLDTVDVVAPMVFAGDTARYYDTWGYRQNGAMFLGQPPYWSQPVEMKGSLLKIDSCGSCFALSPWAWRHAVQWSGHWPFRGAGNMWLDTECEVRHP